MNTTSNGPTLASVSAVLRSSACVAAVLIMTTARAQTDNFNSGNASAWVHYDVGDIGAVAGVPGLGATYSFPPDGSGGFAYRIYSPPDAPYDGSPYGFGPSRAATFRPDVVYAGRFLQGVDVLTWNNGIDQAFGPMWYIQNPGPGTTTGFSFTWEPVGQELLISEINNEVPGTAGRLRSVKLDPTKTYRMQISSHDGSTFLAQIFERGDLTVPVASCLASDAAFPGGISGLLVYDGTSPSVVGADATWDNYAAAVPAANSLRATLVHASPGPNEKSTALHPTISVGIMDRDTTVDSSSILLWLDGALIPAANVTVASGLTEADTPSGYPNTFGGATLTYTPAGLLAAGALHTNVVAFRDSASFWQTNTWTWVSDYPYLRASNSLPLGSFAFRGWNVRTVWTNGPTLGNSLARAELQLATPPQIPWLMATQTVLQVLNWNDSGDGTLANPFGHFLDPALVTNVPGLAPDGTHDNIACEMFAYLELTAGQHQFGAVSDDGFQIRSGNGLKDPNAAVLGQKDGGTFDGRFDFIVEATGLYPVRAIWYENGGGADFQLFSADLGDTNVLTLVNDPTNPTGVVKAYVPLRLLSASSPAGPFSTELTAVIDPNAQTVTVPMSGTARFYRLQTPYPSVLNNVGRAGNSIVMHYQAGD